MLKRCISILVFIFCRLDVAILLCLYSPSGFNSIVLFLVLLKFCLLRFSVFICIFFIPQLLDLLIPVNNISPVAISVAASTCKVSRNLDISSHNVNGE